MDDLTKEQKVLLCSMYKDYLSKQPALTPDKANYFGDSNIILKTYLPEYSSDYVSDICWRLKEKGYIMCYPGDNLANDISITDETIIYMENRFKNGIKGVLDFIIKLR
jgi:hypothetical protein